MNTMRYVSLFATVIDANMPQPAVNFREDQLTTFEILMNQRRFNMQQAMAVQGTLGANQDVKIMLPPELERQY